MAIKLKNIFVLLRVFFLYCFTTYNFEVEMVWSFPEEPWISNVKFACISFNVLVDELVYVNLISCRFKSVISC